MCFHIFYVEISILISNFYIGTIKSSFNIFAWCTVQWCNICTIAMCYMICISEESSKDLKISYYIGKG